jgi:hypothetical protein
MISFNYHSLFRRTDINWFDQQIQDIHYHDKNRNVKWQDGLKSERFKSLLRMLVMDMNLKSGISQYPAKLLLTHPKETEHVIDICVYTFDEFFDMFAEHWITFAFKRHWPGQGNKSESDRAERIMNDPNCSPWILNGVSGYGPKSWADDAPSPENRKTCFTCSIEIKSPVNKWETLRKFRLSLLESGFFGVKSSTLEKVTHEVIKYFNGNLIYSKEDNDWLKVLEIANQMQSNDS